MKLITVIVVASVIVAVYGEQLPPQYQRAQAPYQARGWRPSGPSFSLPEKQQKLQQQQQQQQAPKPVYGPPPFPSQGYGVPPPAIATTTTELPETTTIDYPEADNSSKIDNRTRQFEQIKQDDDSAFVNQGVYYIYHPTGLLQRVLYQTRDDARNMAYTAQIKYQNVEPIREPIYTYDPNTLVFQKVQL